MNYIILLATSIILKTTIKHLRIFLSSLIGSIYAVISMLNILSIYSNVILKILLSIIMIYIAFPSKNFKTLFKQLLIFYMTSFTFGGVAFALLYFIKPQDILMRNGIYIGTYTIKVVILGGILGFVIIKIAFKIIKSKLTKKDIICDLEINFNNKKSCIKALIDTGNLLKEPITGLPVIIVESNKVAEILPKNILNNLEQIINGNYSSITNIDEYISKFRVIPFSSIGKQNGLLLGFKCDYITIYVDDKEKIVKNVIIGLYEKMLSKEDKYNALVGLDIIENN